MDNQSKNMTTEFPGFKQNRRGAWRIAHLIYPGQQLALEKTNGVARLRVAGGQDGAQAPLETVRVSPQVRVQALADTALPTLKTHLIEPFLSEPLIIDDAALQQAP